LEFALREPGREQGSVEMEGKKKRGAVKASPGKKFVLNVNDVAVAEFLEARAKSQVQKEVWREMTDEDKDDAAREEFRTLKELEDGGALEFEDFQLCKTMKRAREGARARDEQSERSQPTFCVSFGWFRYARKPLGKLLLA
jgi:hypothetical protein